MTRRRAAALLVAGLAVAACGKYGPPVRTKPAAEVSSPTETATSGAEAESGGPDAPQSPETPQAPSEETEP